MTRGDYYIEVAYSTKDYAINKTIELHRNYELRTALDFMKNSTIAYGAGSLKLYDGDGNQINDQPYYIDAMFKNRNFPV